MSASATHASSMMRLGAPTRLLRSQKALATSSRCIAPRQTRRHYASVDSTKQDPTELDRITTLPNGVRVASEELPGHFSGVGVYVDAGSRYEDAPLRGVSHIIDRLAFKSTKSRSADEMLELQESLGGSVQCASSRETLMYQAATFNSAVPTATALLAETIKEPLVTEEEVQQQLETAEYEIGEIWSKPDLILPELVHVAAYKGNTLGNPLLCPEERLAEINKETIDMYRSIFYRPERLVVAFAGVKHDEAIKLAERHFSDIKSQSSPFASSSSSATSSSPTSEASSDSGMSYSSPTSNSSIQEPTRLLNKIPFFKNLSTSAQHQATVSPLVPSILQHPPESNLTAASHYTGGIVSLPPLAPPPNPALPRLSYIHLAFEALPISSKDIYALATLQTLLGGGGSFSAGGPGKGMYSRLYTNVLNQHGWVESCIAFNHAYTDSGLFGISASCVPARISNMLEVMCQQLHALTLDHGHSALQEGEVRRAKNQLRSSLLMNLESRMVELEDLGRQVQVHGKRTSVWEMCKQIEELTVQDLRRVAKQVLTGALQNPGKGTGAPTVVLQEGEEEGRELKQFPWGEIQERIGKWQLGRR